MTGTVLRQSARPRARYWELARKDLVMRATFRPPAWGMRTGFSLVELLMVLALAALLAVVSLPRIGRMLDRMAVQRAARDALTFYQTARFASLVYSAPVRVQFGRDQMVAAYELAPDSVFLIRPGPALDGVELIGTRLTTRLHASGLGTGAANLTLTFRRGGYEEKLTLSRLGRMKRW